MNRHYLRETDSRVKRARAIRSAQAANLCP